MNPTRNSRQRDAIRQELSRRCDHPTAETIYLALKEKWPGLSLGTVYRNLAQLCEAEMALKIPCSGPDRFDGNVAPHTHLTCECCGGVFDLPAQNLAEVLQKAEQQFDGKITGCTLALTGLCPACLKVPQTDTLRNSE